MKKQVYPASCSGLLERSRDWSSPMARVQIAMLPCWLPWPVPLQTQAFASCVAIYPFDRHAVPALLIRPKPLQIGPV